MNQSIFEKIKQITSEGNEYWSSRDLAKILGYSEYRHFSPVIEKAKNACINSKNKLEDHFEDILEMVSIGSGANRTTKSIALSRYAAYLVVQNADSSKEIVALGQTYFAIQTRKQEIIEQEAYQSLKSEDEKRKIDASKKISVYFYEFLGTIINSILAAPLFNMRNSASFLFLYGRLSHAL
jgi:DNA-damage-inducible protein D